MCDQPRGDGAAVGVQSLRDVAGGALWVVLQVLDDASLDVVLALTRSGAAVAGATRGRSARRAPRHHRRCASVESGDGGVGAPSRVRCVCMPKPPDPLEVARDEERERDPARESAARPRGSRSWPQAPRLGAVALRWLSGLRLKSCPQGQLNYPQYSLSGPVPTNPLAAPQWRHRPLPWCVRCGGDASS